MADNVTIDNGGLTDFTASTDEGAGGHVQRVKLAYSADGSETHVSADASGLLVNLGANNAVTLASGTLTAVSGTVAVSIPGTPTVNLADSTATISGALGYGTSFLGYVGLATSGTAIADTLELTSGTAVAVGLYDSAGAQVSFAQPRVCSATPTLSTAVYAAGDCLDTTILSFTNAAAVAAGSGHILRMTVIDDDDQAEDLTVHFFESSVTPATENSAHALSDGDADEYIGSISTSVGTWQDHTNNRTVTITPAPPLPFKLDSGTTLYGIAVTEGTPTYTASGLEIKLQIMPD